MNKLYYIKIATEWTEALPLGNGRIGAMDFGNPQQEYVQFNEDSLWSGNPSDRDVKVDIAPLKDQALKLLDEGKYAEVEKLINNNWQGQPVVGNRGVLR